MDGHFKSAGRETACLPALVLLLAAAPAMAETRPNVIFISIDTLRADRVGCYGYARDTTPRLDAFARDAVLFENVVSAAPWTLPSHMSMFTALYPERHGLAGPPKEFSVRANLAVLRKVWRSNGLRGIYDRYREGRWRRYRLRAGVKTLAEILREDGYSTAGFAATHSLRGRVGFSRGFDVYDAVEFRPGPEQARLALRWVSRRREKPFFLFLHIYDAHSSMGKRLDESDRLDPPLAYGGPRPFRDMFDDGGRSRFLGDAPGLFELFKRGLLDHTDIRYLNALYDGGVRYADAIVGDFLDGMKSRGLYDDAVILLTSDHGEALMVPHSSGIDHGNSLYRELVHVPMLLKLPGGVGAGSRVRGLARTVDYLPTILEAAGVWASPAASWDGVSLIPRVRGGGAPAPEAYSSTNFDPDSDPPIQSLERADGWKILFWPYTNKLELYNLTKDPHESVDLAARRPDVAGEMQEALLKHNGVLSP